MEIYSLLDLLHYMQEQQSKGFQGINLALEILKGGQEPLRKKSTIMSTFRACGLYEIGYGGDYFSPRVEQKPLGIEDKFLSPYRVPKTPKTTPFAIQLMACDVINGVMRIELILN